MQGAGCRVQGAGFRGQGSGFRVQEHAQVMREQRGSACAGLEEAHRLHVLVPPTFGFRGQGERIRVAR